MQQTGHFKPFHFQFRLKEELKKSEEAWSHYAGEVAGKRFSDKKKEEWQNKAGEMDPVRRDELLALSKEIMSVLGLQLNLNFWLDKKSDASTIGLAYKGNEAQLIISDHILATLNRDELRAAIAHEIAHLFLYQTENGDYEIAERMLFALSLDIANEEQNRENIRIYRQCVKAYCDKVALQVCNDPDVLISALIKMQNGTEQTWLFTCLSKAEEELTTTESDTLGTYYAEVALRVWSIQKMTDSSEWEQVEAFILEKLRVRQDMQHLDVFFKEEIRALCRELIADVMNPVWMRSPSNLALAKTYFPDFTETVRSGNPGKWNLFVEKLNNQIKSFLAYVLYDFAYADEAARGRVLRVADRYDLKNDLIKVVRKENDLSTKKANEWCENALRAISEMKDSDENKIAGTR